MNEQVNESVVKIKIVGVGGGGKNAVERMLETNIPLVNYVTINTDDGAVKHHTLKQNYKLDAEKQKVMGLVLIQRLVFAQPREVTTKSKRLSMVAICFSSLRVWAEELAREQLQLLQKSQKSSVF